MRKRRCRLVRERIRRRKGRDERPGKRAQSLPPLTIRASLGRGWRGVDRYKKAEGEDDCGSTDRGRGGGTRWIWIQGCWIQGLGGLERELEG